MSENNPGVDAMYSAHKAEVRLRMITHRVVVLVNLSANGAILSFALTQSSNAPHLVSATLVAPFVSFILYGMSLMNALVTDNIGAYLKDLGDPWEEKSVQYQSSKRTIAFASVSSTFGSFIGVPALALYLFVSLGKFDTTTSIVFGIGVGLLAIIFVGLFSWFLSRYTSIGLFKKLP
jgi:hypothetical protein